MLLINDFLNLTQNSYNNMININKIATKFLRQYIILLSFITTINQSNQVYYGKFIF